MGKHKIFGGGKTTGWVVNVVKNKMGYEAPIIGVIANSFDDISSFVGLEEDNVALEPIFNDVLGERARATVTTAKTALDEFEAELHQFFFHPKYPPQIPAVELFGLEECDQEANKLASQADIPLSLKETVDTSQLRAIQTILDRKISVTWGPPGTGKSRVLGEAMLWLLENTTECMVGTAVANVAVDALLRKVVEGYRSRHPKGDIPIARVYSQAQIDAQYATGELDMIDEEYHLETLRVKRARTEGSFIAFLDAVDQLREFGSLRDEALHNAYMKQGKQLMRMVLEGGVRIVFCTITVCQSAALYEVHGTDNEIEWAYPAKSAFLDDASAMTRPIMEIPVMTFVKTLERLSIAGDPYQLPALILSPFAKIEWPGSWLKKIVDQKWPVTFLDTQYRMYDMLYDHLTAIIYAGELKRLHLNTVKSVRTIASPSALGLRLNAAMPIKFEVGRQSFELDSILSFIDVADGVQRSLEAGSSWNIQEINAIDSAILKLISIGFLQQDIVVITGYSEQKRLLTKRAEEHGWNGVKQMMTVDSSQGDEYQIIFLSLVTTKNLPGFMGTRFRACVGTSRQVEAIYFVGKADYWFTSTFSGFKFMHNILKHIRDSRHAWDQPPFILRPSNAATATLTLPSHPAKGKGKGKEVAALIDWDPVTVPASEKLKTFQWKADQRRKAAKAAAEAEIAAIGADIAAMTAKKAQKEQEHAEMLRLLDEDISAEKEALRIEAQIENIADLY